MPESEMTRKRYQGHHSICQMLRDIYGMTEDKEIKLKCRIAVAMAKAMHEQLKKYNLMFNAQQQGIKNEDGNSLSGA